MNGTIERTDKEKSKCRKTLTHTAEINPFFTGVLRRYQDDDVGKGQANSMNFAMYSYGGQNPVRMIDPDGTTSLDVGNERMYANQAAADYNNTQVVGSYYWNVYVDSQHLSYQMSPETKLGARALAIVAPLTTYNEETNSFTVGLKVSDIAEGLKEGSKIGYNVADNKALQKTFRGMGIFAKNFAKALVAFDVYNSFELYMNDKVDESLKDPKYLDILYQTHEYEKQANKCPDCK